MSSPELIRYRVSQEHDGQWVVERSNISGKWELYCWAGYTDSGEKRAQEVAERLEAGEHALREGRRWVATTDEAHVTNS